MPVLTPVCQRLAGYYKRTLRIAGTLALPWRCIERNVVQNAHLSSQRQIRDIMDEREARISKEGEEGRASADRPFHRVQVLPCRWIPPSSRPRCRRHPLPHQAARRSHPTSSNPSHSAPTSFGMPMFHHFHLLLSRLLLSLMRMQTYRFLVWSFSALFFHACTQKSETEKLQEGITWMSKRDGQWGAEVGREDIFYDAHLPNDRRHASLFFVYSYPLIDSLPSTLFLLAFLSLPFECTVFNKYSAL
jgi:hypothetical protein